MILDVINPHRVTLNNDPDYNVQLRSSYPVTKVPYKPECGEDSFEIIHTNMFVTVTFISGDKQSYVCDRVIEEFDKLVLIKNFKQVSFDLTTVERIVVD